MKDFRRPHPCALGISRKGHAIALRDVETISSGSWRNGFRRNCIASIEFAAAPQFTRFYPS
jgi:hypothetical protein